ncbi:hypothetical protein U8V72_21290 [Priestia filamentosa]|uniref:hypothetical protein n=1 Tax=Priestia filamentosa TaxID=1402861 RepID=UPI00397BC857
MGKHQWHKVTKEMKLYSDEEREKTKKKQLLKEEKELKSQSLIQGIGCFVIALVFAFLSESSLHYFLLSLVFFAVAVISNGFILKANWIPLKKNRMLLFPNLLYICGIVVPLALINQGIL